MDYKEKYEQALERCKEEFNFNNLAYSHEEIKQKLQRVFPELKESEDERMRKGIIRNLEYLLDRAEGFVKDELKERIAWLEKQGKQKSSDKVEPKFKVGDWIVYCNEDIDLITGVEETGYVINKGSGYIPFVCEDEMHIWTIQDAKDGDVLDDGDLPFIFKKIDANNYSYAYCGISLNGNFRIDSDGEFGEWTWMQDIKPATKERRDLLFQKMKEAGYEWDAEKKELKIIEQTPAWSEEDEKILEIVTSILQVNFEPGERFSGYEEYMNVDLINWLKSLKEKVQPRQKQEWSEDDEIGLGDALWAIEQARTIAKNENDMGNIYYTEKWPKSLRLQHHWKPSEEQMLALGGVLDYLDESDNEDADIIRKLINDLKKL